MALFLPKESPTSHGLTLNSPLCSPLSAPGRKRLGSWPNKIILLIHLSVHTSVPLFFHPYIFPPIHSSIRLVLLSLHLSIYLSCLHPSFPFIISSIISVSPFFHPPIFPFTHHPSILPFLYHFSHPSIHSVINSSLFFSLTHLFIHQNHSFEELFIETHYTTRCARP